MSNFTFTCPHCNQQLAAEEEWIGMQTECPYCKQTVTIVKSQEAPVSVPNAAAPDEKACPFCGQTIKREAIFCKHCKRDLNVASGRTAVQMEPEGTFPYICPDCDTFVELPISLQEQTYECTGCAESHIATPATERKCPYCSEKIKIRATICRYCRKPVPPLSSKTTQKAGFLGKRQTNPQPAMQIPRAYTNVPSGGEFWGITKSTIGFIQIMFYAWLACDGILIIFSLLSMLFVATSALMIVNFVFGIVAIVAWCMLYYQYWKLVPVSEAETTPGKAVGFLFIPFFQIYWVFAATLKLSKHYDQFDDIFNKIGFTISKIYIVNIVLTLVVFFVSFFSGIARGLGAYDAAMILSWITFGISLVSSAFGIAWMFAMFRCTHNIPRID